MGAEASRHNLCSPQRRKLVCYSCCNPIKEEVMAEPQINPDNQGGFDYLNNPTWRIFRIMSEFVEGFTFLACIEKSVTFFGSARLPEGHPYYELARIMGRRLSELGYTV